MDFAPLDSDKNGNFAKVELTSKSALEDSRDSCYGVCAHPDALSAAHLAAAYTLQNSSQDF